MEASAIPAAQLPGSNNVLLVDGMALLFRGYYANSYGGYIRKTKAGLPTNAVFGFMKYLLDAIKTFKPTHVICCWDMGSKTFRTEKFTNYKANRPEAPLELIPQFELVKEVVASFDIPNVGIAGYEADDCIGTLSRKFGVDSDVHVLTGDHDMLQLVSERVKVIIMKKGASNYAVYDPETLLAEKQLTAAQFIDLKGLIGDTSDNYPGVKGIGEKTAVKLLLEHGSIDGIVANLGLLAKSVKTKIEADLEMLHLCRELATIYCEAPIECALEESLWSPDFRKVHDKFTELELNSLVKEVERLTAVS
ncbi:5'-3' exonuclease [Paenibacillus sp. UNCCL117]|uniref:5'-3' exonuclease n=1 Tax=unclassified Paenibacillus TaxID=185978 RepID=UPI0008881F95|nr:MULTISPECIES: 5'-3' exonuclease H3TH domain-containing protein [unclassified Paenibacillus]SDC01118.1 5'-3' exonuclease [Paenibacillus sp. cl123]SFW36517.1 5'-3' exonuclease [Paenibacillus sp. UNCCL117]